MTMHSLEPHAANATGKRQKSRAASSGPAWTTLGLPMTAARAIRIAALAIVVAAHVAYAFLVSAPGHFTIDESVYHMMVKSFAERGSLEVWTGYGDSPSAELKHLFLVQDERDPTGSRFVPQYPSLFAVIAAPFYLAAGFQGLFHLNLLALMATLALCIATAQRLFEDRDMALDAGLILLLGTFTWEYAHGAWPHALSMLFVSAAAFLGITALRERAGVRADVAALCAGLVIGIGAGVRYDAILITPALALPFLFRSPPRFRPVCALVLGLAPGLLALALLNDAKFGVFSPLSYGDRTPNGPQSVASYAPLLAAGAAMLMALWIATRAPVRRRLAERPYQAAAGVAVLVTLALLVPALRELALRLGHGAWQIVVDLRVRDPAALEWGVTRTADGAVVYGNSIKKALLQSCPWLVVALMPLAGWLRGRLQAPGVSVLFLGIGAFIGAYAYFAWHGGFAMNMRYLLPILPFASILGAWAIRAIGRDLPAARRRFLLATGLAGIVVWVLLFLLQEHTVAGMEPLLLDVPLALAAVILALLGARLLPWPTVRPTGSGLGLAVTAAALAWATTVTALYDLPRSTIRRNQNHAFAEQAGHLVHADSIVFTHYASQVGGFIEADRIRRAFPFNDDFADFRRLVELYLDRGRPVYVAFDEEYWDRVAAEDLLEGLDAVPLFDDGYTRLARVERR